MSYLDFLITELYNNQIFEIQKSYQFSETEIQRLAN